MTLVPTMEAVTERAEIMALVAQMENEFASWRSPLMDIGDFIAPYHHEFYTESETGRGERRDSQIVNETPEQALSIAVSGLFNGLCDPTDVWMALETGDPDLNKLHDVKVYLEDVRDRLMAELAKSNFYTVVPEDFTSILAFGTCASIALEAFDDACFWFGAMPIGTYFVANNNRRRIDQVARRLRMTARQMEKEFGRENLSEAAQTALRTNKGETQFTVVHVVRPNPDFRDGALMSREKKYDSCYYEGAQESKGKGGILLEEGFDSFPIQVARWQTRGNGSWGFGLGHRALASSKGLQAVEVDVALARELGLNPSLLIPPGITLDALALLPGSQTKASDPAGAQQVKNLRDVQFDLPGTTAYKEELEERVNKGFWVNVFLSITNAQGQMTAHEVLERVKEKRIVLTPILRLTHEYLTPRIARCLDIMGKRGLLPPFPPEMAGQTLRIQYKSVLAQAAQLQSASAIQDHLANFVVTLANLKPEALDNYDFDEMARGQATRSGIPESMLTDPKDRDQMRAQRAQQANQQQQMDQEKHAADTALTLSKTNTEVKSALTDVADAMGKAKANGQ